MLRDEELYPNADAFIPERYSEPAPKHLGFTTEEEEREWRRKRDPRGCVFGFGRRVCPGAHLIEESLWIVMAIVVATLELGWGRDERGRVRRERVSFDNAVFRCVALLSSSFLALLSSVLLYSCSFSSSFPLFFLLLSWLVSGLPSFRLVSFPATLHINH